MWKRPFPRRFNVESTWCVCRDNSDIWLAVNSRVALSAPVVNYQSWQCENKNTTSSDMHRVQFNEKVLRQIQFNNILENTQGI